MSVKLDVSFLQLDYQKDENSYDALSYFEEEGNLPFNSNSDLEMVMMMQRIGEEMSLDEYSLKKLEIFLRTELPFFAVTRRLVLQWVTKNFLY